MRLKLKEDPREWQKFTGVMMVLMLGIGTFLWRKAIIGRSEFFWIVGVALAACLASLVWPKPFRTFYRAGMTASFHVGRVIGTIMLVLLFLLVLTPLGLLLRALGKDLLQLKRSPSAQSYWLPAQHKSRFERMF